MKLTKSIKKAELNFLLTIDNYVRVSIWEEFTVFKIIWSEPRHKDLLIHLRILYDAIVHPTLT